jgi:hypothetical protein
MRKTTQSKIDALHARIAKLIEDEKVHYDSAHPEVNRFWRHVEHTRIEMMRHSPEHREQMKFAVARLP